MPREFSRQVRIADQIQRSLAQLIPQELGDPRIGMVNINSVDVSPDYANAKVFVTFVNRTEPKEIRDAIGALNKAASFLRSQLAKQLNSRSTPRLNFAYDEATVGGQKLSRLIDEAVAADRKHHDEEN